MVRLTSGICNEESYQKRAARLTSSRGSGTTAYQGVCVLQLGCAANFGFFRVVRLLLDCRYNHFHVCVTYSSREVRCDSVPTAVGLFVQGYPPSATQVVVPRLCFGRAVVKEVWLSAEMGY